MAILDDGSTVCAWCVLLVCIGLHGNSFNERRQMIPAKMKGWAILKHGLLGGIVIDAERVWVTSGKLKAEHLDHGERRVPCTITIHSKPRRSKRKA